MKLVMLYFKIPFWRAEAGRLALHLGGIPFEDRYLNRDSFRELRANGTLPFGQVPVLLVDGQPIAQTGAVARFCGKLSGHYPDDPWLAAQVDMWIDAATDVTSKVSQTMRLKDPVERLAARQRLVDGELAKWLSNFERLLNDHEQGQWLVGEQLSIADLAIWRLCGWLTGGFLDGIPTTVLEPYPKLQAISDSVGELREIKEWMKRYNKVS